jgi:hypothetical protein
MIPTSVYTGLNPFNFIRKHSVQICLWDVSYERSYCSFRLIERASILIAHACVGDQDTRLWIMLNLSDLFVFYFYFSCE